MKEFLHAKKYLLLGLAALLVAVFLAPIPAPLYPGNYKGLPFKAYCPAYNLFRSTERLKETIEYYELEWSTPQTTLDILTHYPSKRFACIHKLLLDRKSVSEEPDKRGFSMGTNMGMTQLSVSHPDLYAYFLQRSFDGDKHASVYELANMYRQGKGVPQDTKKARHLYRLGVIRYSLPSLATKTECYNSFDDNYKSARNDLETEQVKWVQNLCTATDKELYDFANYYMERSTDHFYPEISTQIYYHLYYARKDKKAWSLYIKADDLRHEF